jgi:hypothetical protein
MEAQLAPAFHCYIESTAPLSSLCAPGSGTAHLHFTDLQSTRTLPLLGPPRSPYGQLLMPFSGRGRALKLQDTL